MGRHPCDHRTARGLPRRRTAFGATDCRGPDAVKLELPLAGAAAIAIALAALCIGQLRGRRRAESALRGLIERQSRMLEEVSATSRMMELLQGCHSLAEMAEVAGRDRVVATDAPGEVVLFDPPGERRALKAG